MASFTKWLSAHLQTKWLWVQVPLQSLKFDITPVSSKKFLNIQATTGCRFTLKHVCDIIRTGNTINTKCLIINQKNYIDCISEIKLSTERLKEKNSLLSNEERQLDWVPGISRPDISFSVFEAGTEFKQPA